MKPKRKTRLMIFIVGIWFLNLMLFLGIERPPPAKPTESVSNYVAAKEKPPPDSRLSSGVNEGRAESPARVDLPLEVAANYLSGITPLTTPGNYLNPEIARGLFLSKEETDFVEARLKNAFEETGRVIAQSARRITSDRFRIEDAEGDLSSVREKFASALAGKLGESKAKFLRRLAEASVWLGLHDGSELVISYPNDNLSRVDFYQNGATAAYASHTMSPASVVFNLVLKPLISSIPPSD